PDVGARDPAVRCRVKREERLDDAVEPLLAPQNEREAGEDGEPPDPHHVRDRVGVCIPVEHQKEIATGHRPGGGDVAVRYRAGHEVPFLDQLRRLAPTRVTTLFPFVVVRLTVAPPPPIRPRTIFELDFPTISIGYPMLTRPFVVSASSCALSSAGSMAVEFPFVVESSTPAPGSSFRISTSIAPFVVLAWAAPRVPTR